MSGRLGRFMERNGVLPTTQFVYRKGLGTCDALLCVSHTLESALESVQEANIVQIDFSAAFDRVNDRGILYNLYALLSGYWRFCVIYTDTVSVKPITARYRGWLLEQTGWCCFRSAAGRCFGPFIVHSVHFGAFFHSGK